MGGYSSIKPKKCKKDGCPNWPKMSLNGFCSVKCMPEDVQHLEKWQKGSISHRKAAKTSQISKLSHLHQKEVLSPESLKNRQEQEMWFESVAKVIAKNPKCWECGTWIPERYYRHATAHIFPKGIFESVSTHPMNYLILGAGCGCHDKTHRLDTFSDMKVFGEAVRRFRLFEMSITEKHKYLTTFLKYANGTI